MVEIRALTPTIGAEIIGVDVRALDEDTFARIHDAFLEHIVIAIRDQELTLEEFVAGYCMPNYDAGSIEVEIDGDARAISIDVRS